MTQKTALCWNKSHPAQASNRRAWQRISSKQTFLSFSYTLPNSVVRIVCVRFYTSAPELPKKTDSALENTDNKKTQILPFLPQTSLQNLSMVKKKKHCPRKACIQIVRKELLSTFYGEIFLEITWAPFALSSHNLPTFTAHCFLSTIIVVTAHESSIT